jgi:hypothetical protein
MPIVERSQGSDIIRVDQLEEIGVALSSHIYWLPLRENWFPGF